MQDGSAVAVDVVVVVVACRRNAVVVVDVVVAAACKMEMRLWWLSLWSWWHAG